MAQQERAVPRQGNSGQAGEDLPGNQTLRHTRAFPQIPGHCSMDGQSVSPLEEESMGSELSSRVRKMGRIPKYGPTKGFLRGWVAAQQAGNNPTELLDTRGDSTLCVNHKQVLLWDAPRSS